MADIYPYITLVTRWFLPVLAAATLLRCASSLLSGREEREVWGRLTLPNGGRVELHNWENIVGRSRACDVVLSYQSMSRSHAALTRDAYGQWTVFDIGSKTGVAVNGKKLSSAERIKSGDIISFGSVKTVFLANEAEERDAAPVRRASHLITTVLLTEYALFLLAALFAGAEGELRFEVPFAFTVLIIAAWACYFMTRGLGRVGFELETLAFMLSATGFSVVASSDPAALPKLTLCLMLGVSLFWLLGWFLRGLERVRRLRLVIAGLGLALLAANMALAKNILGARNWLQIGGVSFQPSELVKICFVFAGASTLDRLFTKRSLFLFVGFAAACVGCLVMMSDFGTALVFFVAYLVIAFMRSGSFATILLSGAGAGFAAFIATSLKPYVAERFAVWGHAWEHYNGGGGYQQTRAMASAASGGLFGLGAGRGWLKHVFAADTDMVFAVVTEELGLLTALIAVLALLVTAVFAVRSSGTARSSFYAIAACASVTIMLTQLILNVFGSLDILPFTGVTFPFVSKGGTSLIASWGLLAFVKAADTRQNASFALGHTKIRRKKAEKPPKKRKAEPKSGGKRK